MDLPLPLSLRKLGLWHGLVWVLRLEGAKTYYLYAKSIHSLTRPEMA